MHSDDLDRLVSSDLPREFRLRALLGGGPRGNVYDAFDAETGRRVALRVLAREPLVRAGLAEAVERTIAAAASLDHPSSRLTPKSVRWTQPGPIRKMWAGRTPPWTPPRRW